jgi:uncharacterized linocin/CFP29 family protein
MSLGRERISWSDDVWKRIDDAVHEEVQRTSVAAKFIPLHAPAPAPDALNVQSDKVDPSTLTVNEAEIIPVVELGVEFRLTRQQIGNEADLATGVALATRAANLLAQAEDIVLFQGDDGFNSPLFKTVKRGGGGAGAGLLKSASQSVSADPIAAGAYGQHTFTAFANAYSKLQSAGHYGPYALALSSEIYVDTYAPLADMLIMPADRIQPLVSLGFYGSGTLPPLSGVLVSVGGNTIDLVMSVDPITEFLQVDPDGMYRFKVYERFVLRVKDNTAIVRFEFKK